MSSPPYPTTCAPLNKMPYTDENMHVQYDTHAPPYPAYPPLEGHQQQQQQQQPTQVVIVQNAPPPLGRTPVQVKCHSCHSTVVTNVREESSKSAYICCFLMCIFGLCCCSCLPFCMENFQNVEHSCPKCYVLIGHYKS